MADEMVEGSCHCGAVRLRVNRAPQEVTDCNCSICQRYGALWAYYSSKEVQVTKDATEIYMWGRKILEFHRCKRCGCVTHWEAVDKTYDRMGVNARLLSAEVLTHASVRQFDGARGSLKSN